MEGILANYESRTREVVSVITYDVLLSEMAEPVSPRYFILCLQLLGFFVHDEIDISDFVAKQGFFCLKYCLAQLSSFDDERSIVICINVIFSPLFHLINQDFK